MYKICIAAWSSLRTRMERTSEALLPGEGAVDRLGDRMDEDTTDPAVESVPMEIVEENLAPAGGDAVPHEPLRMSDGANEGTNSPSAEKASHLPSCGKRMPH